MKLQLTGNGVVAEGEPYEMAIFLNMIPEVKNTIDVTKLMAEAESIFKEEDDD